MKAKNSRNKTLVEVTVGPKYQTVIPKNVRRHLKGLKPGKKVYVYPINEYCVQIATKPLEWSDDTYGVFEDIWQDKSIDKQLKKMRKSEWK